jgi:hypothetical protein
MSFEKIAPLYYDLAVDRWYECPGCTTKIELFSNNMHIPNCGNAWCKYFGFPLHEVAATPFDYATPLSAVKVL